MIANEAGGGVATAFPEARAGAPQEVFLSTARAHPAAFLLFRSGNGFELACATQGAPGSGRAFMKVCSLREGHTLAFFYKRSLLPFSRDRLSYGGCEWPDAQVDATQARAGLDFLASGLDPAARPAWLRRSLPCTVPE